MPILYGSYRSRATRNLWLAEEIGLELDLVPVWQAYRLDDPGAPVSTRSPDFLRLNAMGLIPVLVDGDLVLTESLAINLYLARRYGGDMGPRDEAENALMTQWTLFAATSLEGPALAILNIHRDGREGTDEGRAEVAAAAARLAAPLGVLETHLSRLPHMVGARFTVADVNLAEVVRYAQAHQPLMAAHPALDAWLRAAQARPAFGRMWAKREAEPLRP